MNPRETHAFGEFDLILDLAPLFEVMTTSLPIFSVVRAAEMVATCAISVVMILCGQTQSTAAWAPQRRSTGLQPAVACSNDVLYPLSRWRQRVVAVVIPSPAISFVSCVNEAEGSSDH